MKDPNVKFIRVHGRIVPIRKKENTAGAFYKRQAVSGATTAAGLAGLALGVVKRKPVFGALSFGLAAGASLRAVNDRLYMAGKAKNFEISQKMQSLSNLAYLGGFSGTFAGIGLGGLGGAKLKSMAKLFFKKRKIAKSGLTLIKGGK